jgi:hypothetical protein
MGKFIAIHPDNVNDSAAGDLSRWCVEATKRARAQGHHLSSHVTRVTPCDRANVDGALAAAGEVIFFFGHGDENSLKGENQAAVVDSKNAHQAKQKAVVAVACKSGRALGPDAIIAGVRSYLGFTIKLGWIPPYPGQPDVFMDAMLSSLDVLLGGGTLQDLRDRLYSELEAVADYYDTGAGSKYRNALNGYFVATAVKDNIAALGDVQFAPLP